MKHINEIKIDGEGKWNKQFNLCSELFMKAQDESLTEQEIKNYLDKWFEERQRLELGIGILHHPITNLDIYIFNINSK